MKRLTVVATIILLLGACHKHKDQQQCVTQETPIGSHCVIRTLCDGMSVIVCDN